MAPSARTRRPPCSTLDMVFCSHHHPPGSNSGKIFSWCLDTGRPNYRALRSTGVDIDEANVNAGECLPASLVNAFVNDPVAVSQMTSVPAGKRASHFDILDHVVVLVPKRQSDQRNGS